jgi:hypothetical protein
MRQKGLIFIWNLKFILGKVSRAGIICYSSYSRQLVDPIFHTKLDAIGCAVVTAYILPASP